MPCEKPSSAIISAGVAINAKCASAGVLAIGAPLWKPSQDLTAAEACKAGSSQSGVSLSHSASAMAPAVADSGAGGRAKTGRGLHRARPRHRVHHGAEHRLGIEHRIGEAALDRLGCDVHQSSPRTMVKKSTFVAAVSARRCSRASTSAACSGRDEFGLDLVTVGGVLPERVGDRRQFCLLLVAAERVAMADLAGGNPDGGAGDRHLADIEGRAAAADAAAHGDQAGFGTAQKFRFRRQAGLVPEADDVFARPIAPVSS